jgi:metallo-beta-lactamase class B
MAKTLLVFALYAAELSVAFSALPAHGGQSTGCPSCAEWNLPQQPFRIFGNTYYVGTRGLSAILVASNDGHVLIDGGLPESAPPIATNIRALGFRIEDVRLILNSHAHFDHAGGIAELRRASRATVVLSEWSARVIREGGPVRGDPQFEIASPIATVANIDLLTDGEVVRAGPLALTAHVTPGHTPGGTSWSWQSCENQRCLNIVYADSLSAVSSGSFRFTASPDYPNALGDFEKSFATLGAMRCDILLTPHPGLADLLGKLERRQRGESPDAFVDPEACRSYVDAMRLGLDIRIARERTGQQ